MAAAKPLAVRLLEQRKIPHEVYAFDSGIRSADAVAVAIGMEAGAVFKTLVLEQDPPRGKPYLVMMPATAEVDLKLLAAGLAVKKLRMASHADAERVTGLQVGGISALALLNRGFTVLIHESCRTLDRILVSAGERGMDVALSVEDLLALTGARVVRAA